MNTAYRKVATIIVECLQFLAEYRRRRTHIQLAGDILEESPRRQGTKRDKSLGQSDIRRKDTRSKAACDCRSVLRAVKFETDGGGIGGVHIEGGVAIDDADGRIISDAINRAD